MTHRQLKSQGRARLTIADLELRIAELEEQFREFQIGQTAEETTTNGCTNGCTGGTCAETKGCTNNCTHACTNGCTGSCGGRELPELERAAR
jgi:hypothetical protein